MLLPLRDGGQVTFHFGTRQTKQTGTITLVTSHKQVTITLANITSILFLPSVNSFCSSCNPRDIKPKSGFLYPALSTQYPVPSTLYAPFHQKEVKIISLASIWAREMKRMTRTIGYFPRQLSSLVLAHCTLFPSLSLSFSFSLFLSPLSIASCKEQFTLRLFAPLGDDKMLLRQSL